MLINFFYQFYPELIREGKIHVAQTPLYIIKTGSKYDYAFSEKEMDAKRKKLPSSAIISRAKGIGELMPAVLGEFVFSEKRTLLPLTINNEKEFAAKLEMFMGIDAVGRREFVGQGE